MNRKQGNILRAKGRKARLRRQPRPVRRPAGSIAHFTEASRQFAEAVTNPFSDAAIGAMIPDVWTPPSIPAMDRLSIDFDPAYLAALYGAIGTMNFVTVSGMFFAIVPRSLAVGWLAQTDESTNSGGEWSKLVNIIPLSETFSPVPEQPIAHMYCLFMALIGTNGHYAEPAVLALDPVAETFIPGFNCIPFSRYDNILTSATGGRIVGAGLKVLSDEAAIETGGTAYGGWMPLEDIYSVAYTGNLLGKPDSIAVLTSVPRPLSRTMNDNSDWETNEFKEPPSKARLHPRARARERVVKRRKKHRTRLGGPDLIPASTLQDSLRYRHTYRGVDGVTTRYSPLQSSTQETFQPVYETALFEEYSQDMGTAALTNIGVGIGTHDLIGSSDYVPAVVWRFNSSEETYSLRVEARVHIQAEPDGNCPFMAHSLVPDPHYSDIQIILENKDAFPVVSKGNSFKSFLKGVKESIAVLHGGLGLAKDVKKLFLN